MPIVASIREARSRRDAQPVNWSRSRKDEHSEQAIRLVSIVRNALLLSWKDFGGFFDHGQFVTYGSLAEPPSFALRQPTDILIVGQPRASRSKLDSRTTLPDAPLETGSNMRSWLRAAQLAALVVSIVAVGFSDTARAQRSAPRDSITTVAEVEKVLRDGANLERQRQWGEALAHYEDALRKHPGQRDLAQRLSVARTHYEVGRRYADASFLASVREIDERAALDLYADVLLKIHAHYVERPEWLELLHRGTTALEIALAEDGFRSAQRGRWTEGELQSHFNELNHALKQRPVRTRAESRETVSFIANSTANRLRVPPQAVVLEYACAAAASLDDYSAFLTANQLDEIMAQIEGSFVGLGIELKSENQTLLIVNVISGGPAELGGLKVGERIVQVNGQTTVAITTDAAADLLKGEEGTTVELVVHDVTGAARQVRLGRQVVEVPSIEQVSVVDQQYGIGYMKLTCFQKTTGRDVESALWQLHRDGMRSVIIDLRGNPGGLLTAAVEVADKFITEGTIVSTRGRGTGEDFDYKAHLVGTWRVPLIVLIDGDSASASEIFAAAIRDAKRGTIVGSRSFGKGSVQGIFPLSAGNAGLRLTTAKFFSPQGHAISGQGVQPHVVVDATTSQTVAKPVIDGPSLTGEVPVSAPVADATLNAALQVARRQLARR